MNAFLLLASPILCCPHTDPPVSLWGEVEQGVTNPATGHVYYKAPRNLSIGTARRLAAELRGTLVALDSKEEETWLIEQLDLDGLFWIGLSDPFDRWDNGELIAYDHWKEDADLTRWPDSPAALVVSRERRDADGHRLTWWEPKHGEVTYDRFQAIIEVDPELAGSEPDPRLKLRPSELYAERGALLLVVEDLRSEELAELDPARCPHLHALREESMWTVNAGADLSGDTLAGWGMLLAGIGRWRSRLYHDGLGEEDFWQVDNSFFCKLEELDEGYTTASLLDDPLMTGCFVDDGQTDIRYTSTRYREASASINPDVLMDLQQRPGPISILAGFSGSLGKSKKERREELSRLDEELGLILETVRGREAYEEEQWLIALASPGPARAPEGKRKKRGNKPGNGRGEGAGLAHPRAVPALLSGVDFPPGETSRTVNLTDLAATIVHHLGGGLSVSASLDGRDLRSGVPLVYGVNLLFDGGAEAREASTWVRDFEAIPGWRLELPVSLQRYRQLGCAADQEFSGPPDRGTRLFVCEAEEGSRMVQCLDLRPCAADVDSGKLRFTLGGWFGGCWNDESGTLRVEFLKEDGKLLRAKSLPAVGAGERRKELGASGGHPNWGLLERSLEGQVPRRARRARIVLEREGGRCWRGGLADELYFDLH